MTYEKVTYKEPDFTLECFKKAPDVKTVKAPKAGIAPENYHSTTIFPEYFKIKGKWILANESRMDSVVAIGENGEISIKEFRNINENDNIVVGRTEDASEGVYVYTGGFVNESNGDEAFTFRSGRSRETSYSRDYDRLYEVLKSERDNGGYIVWVLGPAVTFDSDSRCAMSELIESGFVNAVFAGNALATHDMEGSMFKTALGQDIYTQASMINGHYNHLDVINRARKSESLEKFIKEYNINDGIINSCIKRNIPIVLAGSIRDDGPLPGVIHNVYDAQDAMREHTKKATVVLGLATQLHSIATGNMTPSYRVVDGEVRRVHIYSIDISEFAVNKLRDRGSLEVTSIVTNIQDFLVNLSRNLNQK